MDFIWHHTVNDGSICKYNKTNIDKKIYSIVKQTFKESLLPKGSAFEIDGEKYSVSTIIIDTGGMTRLCQISPDTDSAIPFLEIAYSDCNYEVYNELMNLAQKINITAGKKPKLPYVSDLVLPSASASSRTLLPWLSDFSCCIALSGILGFDFLKNV